MGYRISTMVIKVDCKSAHFFLGLGKEGGGGGSYPKEFVIFHLFVSAEIKLYFPNAPDWFAFWNVYVLQTTDIWVTL